MNEQDNGQLQDETPALSGETAASVPASAAEGGSGEEWDAAADQAAPEAEAIDPALDELFAELLSEADTGEIAAAGAEAAAAPESEPVAVEEPVEMVAAASAVEVSAVGEIPVAVETAPSDAVVSDAAVDDAGVTNAVEPVIEAVIEAAEPVAVTAEPVVETAEAPAAETVAPVNEAASPMEEIEAEPVPEPDSLPVLAESEFAVEVEAAAEAAEPAVDLGIEEPLEFGLFEDVQAAAAGIPVPEIEPAAPVDQVAAAPVEPLPAEAVEAAPPMPEMLSSGASEFFDAPEFMLEELLAEQMAEPVEEPVEAPVAAAPLPPPPPPPVPRFEPEPIREPERASPPALDELIRGIDEQLESSTPVAVTAEQPVVTHKQFSQLDDYVVFTLSGGDYALPVRDVAEIGRVPTVTKVPNVPEFVRGITNLRGEIVPVLNLPQLLGLQETAVTARGRVLFLQARENVSASGLLVDEVKGIQRIPSQQLEHVTGLVDDKVTSVLRGVHGRGDRLLNVLDLEQVFRLEEFQKFDRR